MWVIINIFIHLRLGMHERKQYICKRLNILHVCQISFFLFLKLNFPFIDVIPTNIFEVNLL